MDQTEILLDGGNVNQVARIGNTVRRAACKNKLVYDLLRSLSEEGFVGAPAYLGSDNTGRDVFSYIPGTVAGNDYPNVPSYMWGDDALRHIGRLLRAYHDATRKLAGSLPCHNDGYLDTWHNEVICHNDAALYNIVFRQEKPVALIDFDMAAPGPRIWDIVYTLYTCVPLASFAPSAEGAAATMPYDALRHSGDRKRRLKLFFDSYGMDIPGNLGRTVLQRIQALCDTLINEASRGDQAFRIMIDEGHLDFYRGEIRFLSEHFSEWNVC